MELLKKAEVINYLTEINALKNQRLGKQIESAHLFFRIPILDSEALQSLIFHYRWESEILTPGSLIGGRLYTVKQVTQKMIDMDISFKDLAEGNVQGKYNPNWFQTCANIFEQFDYDAFDDLVVKLPTNSAQRDCPLGTFQIIDGMHRSLVLSYLLATQALHFKPLHCILVLTDEKLPWIA